MEIVLASRNKKKIAEMNTLLSKYCGDKVKVLSLDDIGFFGDIEEDGNTFEENSAIKACAPAKMGYIGIADDSGLCVDALDGAPGIFSARWAGEHGNDAANNQKLMRLMEGVPRERRTARFHSSVVLVERDEDGEGVTHGEGDCEGFVGTEPRGDGGFGYDPLFLPNDTPDKTMAELSADEKNAISHRFHALQDLAQKL